MKIKILTLADGFGDSIANPSWYPEYHKWPTILELVTKNTEVLNLSRYGAGNEYIVGLLRQHYKESNMVFVQWATPSRLDLLLGHNQSINTQWQDIIRNDPVYYDNIKSLDGNQWWISSGSRQSWVKEYHNKFISEKQHQFRSKLWIEYAYQILKGRPHGFMLTADSLYLDGIDVPLDAWVWHKEWRGMDDWRFHSLYRDLDLGVTQPIPLIHFDFIKQFIMPKFDLPWRSEKEINAVENMLLRKYNLYKGQKP